MRRARWVAALIVVLLAATPAVADACAVCFDPKAQNRMAFFATTVVLSLLPLAMVAGLLLWLWRRARSPHGERPTLEAVPPGGS